MPTQFQESAVTGTKWNRCRSMHVSNGYQEVPSVSFQEETLVAIEGLAPLVVGTRNLDAPFDASAQIELRNPITDELTGGKISQGKVYAILYSLYRQMADAPE